MDLGKVRGLELASDRLLLSKQPELVDIGKAIQQALKNRKFEEAERLLKKVGELALPLTLADVLIARQFANTRAQVQRLVVAGWVQVDGKLAEDAQQDVRGAKELKVKSAVVRLGEGNGQTS